MIQPCSSICSSSTTLIFIVLSLCHVLLASWSPIPPNFPYPPGPPMGWPMRPPQGPPPNFFRPSAPMPAPMPFPLGDFTGFAPIGFEYPSQEELLQIEREKKLRKERQKVEKLKSIGKRNEDQRSTFATTTESNDHKTSTEATTNSFEDKTRFDDSKSSIKLTEFDKMKEDRVKSYYKPGDLKDKSESKNEERKRPVDVKRKQTVNSNGQVTFITEMLYDIDGGNPFKPTTSPPSSSSPYLPPTTDGMYNPTDDPRLMTQTAHPYTTYLPGTIPRPGDASDDRQWHLMPTPPTPFRSSSSNKQQQYVEKGDSRRGSGSHPHQGHHNHHHHHHNYRGSSSSPSSNSKGSTSRRDGSSNSITSSLPAEAEGLGAAAIAGIVIGSLVSVALLAGTALFVMYKSPFGKRMSDEIRIGQAGGGGHHHHHSSQIPVRHTINRTFTANSQTASPQGDVRVYRWPPKRCPNHSSRNASNHHN